MGQFANLPAFAKKIAVQLFTDSVLPVLHFSKTHGGRGYFDQFIFGDIFHGLFEAELTRRNDPQGLIGTGGPYLVSFFSFVISTQMSSAREFSPTTIPV